MEIQIETERKIYGVSQLTKNIRSLLERQYGSVWVEGEISNFIHHTSGHMYFSLKDNEASMQCAMFQRANSKLRFKPENGLKIICHGMISVYPPRGQYQLIADAMEPKGLGDLQLAFEQLKNKLNKEGLFNDEHKKPLPFLPQKVGIITSPTGAVIRDIFHVIDRRYPDAHLVVAPIQVQGAQAKQEIVQAIENFNEWGEVDVVILARGGGSLEDLWPFNEEMVARAIFASNIPVISAIGHEVDYTIADFVSDFRAPTPSAAAEIVYPPKKEIQAQVMTGKKALKQALLNKLEICKERLESLLKSRALTMPSSMIDDATQKVDDLMQDMKQGMQRLLDYKTEKMKSVMATLHVLSPLASLTRGYSIVFDSEGKRIIKSTGQIKEGNHVRVRLSDGEFESKVTHVEDVK